MTASLEKVIKDLEFENEDLLRQVKDEIGQIDCMQKDISIKIQENAKLEKDIDSLNSETKTLHEQFKQNKEITESLKYANTMLQRHIEDLKKTLNLKKEERKRECEQHESILRSYNEKWNKYREVYEERPLAQVTRKMKLEAASLDMEEKKVTEKREALQKHIQEIETSRGKWKLEKQEAIEVIIQLAQIKINAKENNKMLLELKRKSFLHNAKLQEKTKAMQELNSRIEQTKYEKAAQFNKVTKQALEPEPVNDVTTARSPTADTTKARKHKMPRLLQPKTFHLPKLPQLKLPKIPQMPKFQIPQIPSFSKSPKAKPIISAPVSQQPQLPSAPLVPSEAAISVPPAGPPCQTTDVPSSVDEQSSLDNSTQETNANVTLNTTQKTEKEGVYNVPLEQSNKEFFGEDKTDYVKNTTPSKSENSPFTFSPGQHAEQLRLLKQSPAGGASYLHTTRLMFNKALLCEKENSMQPEDEFTNSFCSQNQFLGSMVKQESGSLIEANKSPRDDFAIPTVTSQQSSVRGSTFDKGSFIVPNSCTSSKEFSFDVPNTSSPNLTSSSFSFHSLSAVTTNDTTFSFNSVVASTSAFASPGVETNSIFSFASPSGNNIDSSPFSFQSSAREEETEPSSNIFDFTIKSRQSENAADSITFNFDTPSHDMDMDLGGKQQRSAFSFGSDSPSTNPSNASNAFSFNF